MNTIPYHKLILTIIFTLGTYLRFSGISDFWINPDEGIYINGAISGNWLSSFMSNAHPPLLYYLIHLSYEIFNNITTVRILSSTFGSLCIIANFLLFQKLLNTRSGLIAASLCAFSPSLITASQLIRPYSLLLCSLTFLCYFLASLVQSKSKKERNKNAYCLSIATSISILTHYSSLIFLSSVVLISFIATKNNFQKLKTLAKSLILPFFITSLLTIIHIIPKLLDSSLHHMVVHDMLRSHYINNVTDFAWNFLGIFYYFFSHKFGLIFLLFFLLGVILLIHKKSRLVFIPLLAISIAAILSFYDLYPLVGQRHSSYLFPFLLIPIIYLISYLTRSKVYIIYSFLALLLITTISLKKENAFYIKNDYFKTIESERFITKDSIKITMQSIKTISLRGEAILMPKQTFYILYPKLSEIIKKRDLCIKQKGLCQIKLNKSNIYIYNYWALDKNQSKLLKTIEKIKFSENSNNMYIISGGWGIKYHYLESLKMLNQKNDDQIIKSIIRNGTFLFIRVSLDQYLNSIIK